MVDLIERDYAYDIEDFFYIADKAIRKKYHPREIHEDILPSNQKMLNVESKNFNIDYFELKERLLKLCPKLWKKFGWEDEL